MFTRLMVHMQGKRNQHSCGLMFYFLSYYYSDTVIVVDASGVELGRAYFVKGSVELLFKRAMV